MDGLAQLAHRFAQLDAEPDDPQVIEMRSDLVHFVSVVERYISPQTRDVRNLLYVSSADADALLENSRLLARLTDTVPEIVSGPLRFDAQYWVRTGNPSTPSTGASILSPSSFLGVADVDSVEVSSKPFHVGLFTSTGVLGTYGMWRTYLDFHEGSSLHPRPWHTWAVTPHPSAVVREIASASQWVDFVLSHPLRNGELLTPDWISVAHRYDAVHMTLRAIAATQGLHFPTEEGIVATGYWDVESTLWLRWCFSSVRLVETVEATPG